MVVIRRLDDVDNPITLSGHRGQVASLSFAEDGSAVVALDESGTVRISYPHCGETLSYAVMHPDPVGGSMRTWTKLVGVALLTMVVASACGGDDAGNDSAGGNDGEDSATTLPSSVGDIPGLSAECEAFADLSLAMSNTLGGGFVGIPDDLVDRLPADARDDGRVIVEALQEFGDRLEDAGIDLSQGIGSFDEGQIETYGEISGEVFDSDVEDAFDRLAGMVADECALGS